MDVTIKICDVCYQPLNQHHKDCQKNKEKHNHDHEHEHGALPVILYLIGLAFALIALFLPSDLLLWKNILFTCSMLSAGYDVVIVEGILDMIHDSKAEGRFMPNSHILMGLASFGSALLGDFWEGTLLILIFSGAHFLEDYAEGKSKREISKLIELSPQQGRLILEDGTTELTDVSNLHVGDRVQVLNGDQIPIDGVILSGKTTIDESSINGESMPQKKEADDPVYASTINGQGSFIMEVKQETEDTVYAKILELVDENQNNQTAVANFIQKYEPHYVRFVIFAVLLLMLLAPLVLPWTYQDSIYRGLLVLVSASPCALAASTVSASLSASSQLNRKGILSKGSRYVSSFAGIEAIAFDKTGTLTQGKVQVTDYYFSPDRPEQDWIDLLVALERESNHPLADAILEAFSCQNWIDLDVRHEIGKGLEADYLGQVLRVGKASSFDKVGADFRDRLDSWSKEGKTVVFLALDETVYGVVALRDTVKEEAKEVIKYFKEQGIHTCLITGDAQETAESIASELELDQVVANVLPEEKSQKIQALQEEYGLTAMVGDGVNDAPALVQADVGFAMGKGTDVAVDVSDMVLMQDDLSKLIQTHQIAKKMDRVIKQNVFFALFVVILLIVMSLTGYSNIALSVIAHEGSTIIVILNGLRLLN